jgi:hypothetical protein
MSGDERSSYVRDLCERINKVIADKWPAALNGEGNPFTRARETNAELMVKCEAQGEEINSLWLNLAPLDKFKAACTEWGRTVLEIHRLFAVEMKGQG